ncbi:hypothetical protein BLA6863_08034 [Burkholderia lata]|uniref:Uncharacterized protein n=1 Tax=Burkholderia lata (strain ATCC 17760 / DSM 23089 / LMG 22485 / NCIMB 9086 / R18194 / 383) TaxID=482957 RepID=A0A6P2SV67_BURL3|nr:hypothetical protein BLA6863_08034 [Burkholderia lata]
MGPAGNVSPYVGGEDVKVACGGRGCLWARAWTVWGRVYVWLAENAPPHVVEERVQVGWRAWSLVGWSVVGLGLCLRGSAGNVTPYVVGNAFRRCVPGAGAYGPERDRFGAACISVRREMCRRMLWGNAFTRYVLAMGAYRPERGRFTAARICIRREICRRMLWGNAFTRYVLAMGAYRPERGRFAAACICIRREICRRMS